MTESTTATTSDFIVPGKGLNDAQAKAINQTIAQKIALEKQRLDDAIANDTAGIPALLRGYARRILQR